MAVELRKWIESSILYIANCLSSNRQSTSGEAYSLSFTGSRKFGFFHRTSAEINTAVIRVVGLHKPGSVGTCRSCPRRDLFNAIRAF